METVETMTPWYVVWVKPHRVLVCDPLAGACVWHRGGNNAPIQMVWLNFYTVGRLRSYAVENGLNAPDEMSIFFTNFFVSRLDWWQQANVQHFLHAVESTGSIFTHRWGDAPIQTSALRMYVDCSLFLSSHLVKSPSDNISFY